MRDGMHIGELAKRCDLNPKTIRYYEEIGLLPEAARSASGYRLYTERDAEQLAFIRRAKALDLSLDEIRDVLTLRRQGEAPCCQVLTLIDEKVREIDQRVAQLQTFRDELTRLRADWAHQTEHLRHVPERVCPIIEQQTEVGAHPAGRMFFERVELRS